MVDYTFVVDGVILSYDSVEEVFSSEDAVLAEMANDSLPSMMAEFPGYFPDAAGKVLEAIRACWPDAIADVLTRPDPGPDDPAAVY